MKRFSASIFGPKKISESKCHLHFTSLMEESLFLTQLLLFLVRQNGDFKWDTHTDTRCHNSKSIRKLYVSCCSRASRSHFIMCAFVCILTSLILSNSFGVDETQRNTQNNSNNNSNDNDNERKKTHRLLAW